MRSTLLMDASGQRVPQGPIRQERGLADKEREELDCRLDGPPHRLGQGPQPRLSAAFSPRSASKCRGRHTAIIGARSVGMYIVALLVYNRLPLCWQHRRQASRALGCDSCEYAQEGHIRHIQLIAAHIPSVVNDAGLSNFDVVVRDVENAMMGRSCVHQGHRIRRHCLDRWRVPLPWGNCGRQTAEVRRRR